MKSEVGGRKSENTGASDFRPLTSGLQKKALPEESGKAFPCNDDLFVI